MDWELYLPRVWADDLERRREAGVPEQVAFRTKAQLARRMLERALESGVPFGWVTGDEVYGNDRNLRRWLERRDVPHVLAVRSNEQLWAETDVGRDTRDGDRCGRTGWRLGWRNPAGYGAARATAPRDPGYKGPWVYDWARVELRPLKELGKGYWRRVRRSIAKPGELAYYVCFGPVDTTLEELVRVAGTRWTIAECFEEAKGEVGLDQYEVRKWDGWYRHITLAMLAHACLAVIRSYAAGGDGKKGICSRENSSHPTDRARGQTVAVPAAVAAPWQSCPDHPLVGMETAAPGPGHAMSLPETPSDTCSSSATVVLSLR